MCLHVNTSMVREIIAVKNGKIVLKDDVLEIYEKRVTPYGNGAKVDSQKKFIGKRVYIIVLKN